MSKNVYVPEDTKNIAPQYSVEDLDNDTYPEASLLPPEERSRIVDRHGKTISENQETTGPSGRVIIAALDFGKEEHVANVTREAKYVAKSGDTVVLFNVLSHSMDGDSGVDKLRLRSDNQVQAVNKITQEFDSGVTTFTHIVHGKTEGQLLKVAKKHNAQLIILGKRKLSGLKKMTTKSVSDAIINQAGCSILIARGTCP